MDSKLLHTIITNFSIVEYGLLLFKWFCCHHMVDLNECKKPNKRNIELYIT